MSFVCWEVTVGKAPPHHTDAATTTSHVRISFDIHRNPRLCPHYTRSTTSRIAEPLITLEWGADERNIYRWQPSCRKPFGKNNFLGRDSRLSSISTIAFGKDGQPNKRKKVVFVWRQEGESVAAAVWSERSCRLVLHSSACLVRCKLPPARPTAHP